MRPGIAVPVNYVLIASLTGGHVQYPADCDAEAEGAKFDVQTEER